MANVNDIRWGRYRQFEGPFYGGKSSFKLPAKPTEEEKILAVITATEGGHWDAYNGYDRCVCTSGLVQWCEAGQYSVSDMLGTVAERAPTLVKPLDLLCLDLGFEFHKNRKGQWRFHFRDGRGEVNTLQEQQQLFLKDSNGTVGTWDEASKAYAKRWAAAISTVWENPLAQAYQCEYTVKRLGGFCLPYAKEFLAMTPASEIGKAFKAMYLSFAANNPTWANRHLEIANKAAQGKCQFWTKEWFLLVAKELTFGPLVSIYPHRYQAIRPVLEKLYGLDLPDFADELKKWEIASGHKHFFDVREVQQALITLGYDLGPAGADGKYGNKTKEAVLLFEQAAGLPPDHQDGMMDPMTAEALSRALEAKAVDALS
jgi:hypothetical protein